MASEKKIKDQQRFNEAVKEELALREKERGVLNALVSLAKVKGKISNDAKKTQQDLQASLEESLKLETKSEQIQGQIEAIEKAKLELIKEAEEKGKAINAHLINNLDNTQKILEKEREISLAKDELMNIKKNILGLDSEIEQAIAKGGVAALAMNKAFENVGASLTAHVDSLKEMVTQQGLSVADSFALKGNIDMASMSMTGLLYGSDQLATSAEAITQHFGNANAATTDMIKGVTQISALTGDAAGAVDLVVAFEDAGIAADDVNDHVKDLATKSGVSAKKILSGMTSQMNLLKGKTQEQLDTILETNAALVKQGTTMDEINGIADAALSIESNMQASAKARVMLGRDVNDNAVRSAALALKSATTDEGRAKAQKDLAAAIHEGVGGQEEFNKMSIAQRDSLAAAYGISTDQLATMLENKKNQDELTAKYGEYAGFVQGAQGFLASGAKMVGSMGLEMAKVVAKTAIMNTMMGGSSGIGNILGGAVDSVKGLGKNIANIGKGGMKDMGAKVKGMFTKDAPGEMPKPKKMSETLGDGGKASGGGGMKEKFQDMAEGLKAMGDAKVFAGIGAVALAGPAFIIALPSIPFLLFMGLTPLKMLETNFTSLAAGLNQMSTAIVGVGVMALAGPALALGLLAIPFLGFMAIPGLGAALSANFIGLASGLAAFGNPATAVFVLIGIGLMAALGVAMIPFAYALSLLTPLLEAFGTIVVNVMSAIPPIISAIADGFVTMFTAITPENALAMMMLGPALLSASVGMIAFSAAMAIGGIASFFGGGIIDQIKELSEVGPGVAEAGKGLAEVATHIGVISGAMGELGSLVTPLYALAGGLMSISGGLTAMAFSGLMAMPVIGGLIALAAIAPALEGLGSFLGGGDDDSGSSSDDALINEIKGLRSDIQAQPIMLTIDGKAVQQISRVQSRQSKNARSFS